MSEEALSAKRARQRREVAERSRAWRKSLREKRRPDGRACDWAVSAGYVLVCQKRGLDALIKGVDPMLRALDLLVARGYDRNMSADALRLRVRAHRSVSATWVERAEDLKAI